MWYDAGRVTQALAQTIINPPPPEPGVDPTIRVLLIGLVLVLVIVLAIVAVRRMSPAAAACGRCGAKLKGRFCARCGHARSG